MNAAMQKMVNLFDKLVGRTGEINDLMPGEPVWKLSPIDPLVIQLLQELPASYHKDGKRTYYLELHESYDGPTSEVLIETQMPTAIVVDTMRGGAAAWIKYLATHARGDLMRATQPVHFMPRVVSVRAVVTHFASDAVSVRILADVDQRTFNELFVK